MKQKVQKLIILRFTIDYKNIVFFYLPFGYVARVHLSVRTTIMYIVYISIAESGIFLITFKTSTLIRLNVTT